ncbi:MAG: metal ABC transporter permease [Eubacteriales bacterium]|nr:metal ABC transporter permease [Eubacteriales bacterium]
MIKALLEYNFLQNALLASILASMACGIIGTIIVEKKLVMLSGGIAHTSFGGIGLGYLIGVEPIIMALVFSVSASIGIVTLNRRSKTNTDLLTGMFWSAGMALGVLFIAFTPGYPPDMSSYLFGNILTVTRSDLIMMLSLVVLVTFLIIALFNTMRAYIFDEEFCRVLKIKTVLLDYLLFILIALTVVVLIRVVGIILVIALLTAPPAAVRLFTYDLKKIMIFSVLAGLLYCITGLWLSYSLNISSGAAIILISILGYLASILIKKIISSAKSAKR